MRWIGSCCIKHFGIATITSENRKNTLPINIVFSKHFIKLTYFKLKKKTFLIKANHTLDEMWGNKEEKINENTIVFA